MNGTTHLRIARPTNDIATAERFWVSGLGLGVLYRHVPQGPDDHALLMLGWPEAAWHLELVQAQVDPVPPTPSPEDLLVLYNDGPVPHETVEALCAHGGTRAPAHNSYWDEWGVTIVDPDGYRLVLSSRGWSNS